MLVWQLDFGSSVRRFESYPGSFNIVYNGFELDDRDLEKSEVTMAGESQATPANEPDPTVLTTQQLDRGLEGERDYVRGEIRVIEQRLNAMDVATRLLNETVNRVPTDVQVSVGSLKDLHSEKFTSVALQFAERDTRQERESRDNKVAVDAAFAAQKEAASEQNKSNTLAIDKSERATAETLNKQADLFQSRTMALDGQIADLKERNNSDLADLKERIGGLEIRITAAESIKKGGTDARAALYAFAGFLVALIVLGGFAAAVWPTK